MQLYYDNKGNERRATSVVYVDRDIDIGGYLYLGNSTASDPTAVVGAKEVRDLRKSPNLRATEYERKALL